MTDDIDAKIIQSFGADIVGRLSEAAVIGGLSNGFGKQGLTERSSLLEIKPPINETKLQASSLVRRRDRDRRDKFD